MNWNGDDYDDVGRCLKGGGMEHKRKLACQLFYETMVRISLKDIFYVCIHFLLFLIFFFMFFIFNFQQKHCVILIFFDL